MCEIKTAERIEQKILRLQTLQFGLTKTAAIKGGHAGKAVRDFIEWADKSIIAIDNALPVAREEGGEAELEQTRAVIIAQRARAQAFYMELVG